MDFACVALKLVIELDGGQHADQIAYDEERTRMLGLCGWRVLRFWNNDVLQNIDGVAEAIMRENQGHSELSALSADAPALTLTASPGPSLSFMGLPDAHITG